MPLENKLYKWSGVLWSYEGFIKGIGSIVKCRCPNDRCELNINSKYKTLLSCPKCDFHIELDKSFYDMKEDALKIIVSDYWKDAEMVNIDGEMTKINKEIVKDSDYWITASISKSIKGGKQLMILIGSKKETDKTQLFLDIDNEKLSFDQKDKHPREILAKVIAEFKESKSEIELKEEKKDPKNLEKLGKNLAKH